MERREGSEGQTPKEGEREGGSGSGEMAQRPLAKEGRVQLRYLCTPPPEFLELRTADGTGLLT